MAKPEKEKDVKPEGAAKGQDGGASKIILMNIITTSIVCAVFIGVFFIMQKSIISQQKSVVTQQEAGEDAEVADDEVEKGIILDLGEFTMNLADTNAKRYLKVAVALEVTKTQADIEAMSGGKSEGEKHGGGNDSGAEKIVTEMEHYKPAIRDAVITTLSSKLSDELSTTTGKELAKDQIKESVDAIFGGEREVIRVSFGQFIIQ